MLESSTNGAKAADEPVAGRVDQRGVAELGFGAGGRAAPEGVPRRGEVADPELVEQGRMVVRSAARYSLYAPAINGSGSRPIVWTPKPQCSWCAPIL